MTKAKNMHLTYKTKEALFTAKEDYENAGRDVHYNINELSLTVYALPLKYRKKDLREARLRAQRETNDPFSDVEDYSSAAKRYNGREY